MLMCFAVILPILCGSLMFLCGRKLSSRIRSIAVISVQTVLLILSLLCVVFSHNSVFPLFRLTESVSVAFGCDGLSCFFAPVTALMWLIVGIYAISYRQYGNAQDENRFFAFYMMTSGCFAGLAFSANPLTMYLFFELTALCVLPLIFHTMTKEAFAAAMKYLVYLAAGALTAMISIFLIYRYYGGTAFVPGGAFSGTVAGEAKNLLLIIGFLAILGFSSKAGMFPFHAWITAAYPAIPPPAGAVLSGVVTTGGVICIIRVVYYTIGANLLRGSWVQYTWLSLALVTILMGSVMAYKEKDLKRRLAYFNISQLSYVLCGLALLSSVGYVGALLHVLFHAVIMGGLFLCAGSVIAQTGLANTDELHGIGCRMPVTLWCFAILSIAPIGIPPASGFVSNWYLAIGALNTDLGIFSWIVPVILLVSAVLTAGYLLPVSVNGFFGAKEDEIAPERSDSPKAMLIPMIILASLSVLLGIFASYIIDIMRYIAL